MMKAKSFSGSGCLVAVLLNVALSHSIWKAMAFEPQLEKCTLQVGGQVLKPTEVTSAWRMTTHVGTNQFLVGDNAVERRGPTRAKPDWIARSADGLHLHWLAAEERVAYLVAYKVDKEGRFQAYELPPRLRRLNLDSGQWLEDLRIIDGTPESYAPKSVVGVLPSKDGVMVLIGFANNQSANSRENNIGAYVLRCFKEGTNKPAWSKQFLSDATRPYTGGYLWGIPPPLYAASAIKPLSWLGDRVLVCAEAMQPIRCLNPDTGSEIWEVDRVWEFQRGFIGPSVWSHYIARFGIRRIDISKNKIEEERKAFDQQYQCALAAGPVSVPLKFARGNDTHSIFLAVVKGPAGSWAGYLSDCVLYELGSGGEPVSMITLPQVVDGSQFSTRPDGVVWKCQNNTFIKVSPSRSAPEVSMGGGGPDGLSTVAWSRQVQYREPEGWFVSGKAGDPVAFGESHAFCLPGGGYISREDEAIYHFPIVAIDLSTGVDSPCRLNVPFKGPFPIPTMNISHETGNGGESYRTRLFHLLAITQLTAEGREIEITLATEQQRYGLKFDLRTVQQRTEAAPLPADADPMHAARARAKLVDPKSRNEALQEAAHGVDVEFLKALLETGADAKYSSPLGWTALMVAATYGTTDMVDALIAAGSDVNAADKNCGGQNILMWAARSGRESKRKIQALLKAGANPQSASTNGYNVLMSAAGAGDLEALEVLLKAGLSVSALDREGQTVLMAGARSGKANIISALVQAGADVSARDKEGKTALMYAAGSVEAAGAVGALLKAGANPNDRDQKGLTALKIAEKSNYLGAEAVVRLLKGVTTEK